MKLHFQYMIDTRKKVTQIQIRYSLSTESGHVISTSVEDYVLGGKNLVVSSSKFRGVWRAEKFFALENREVLNKQARKLLIEARKSGIKDLVSGVYVQGKHIVKCTYDVDFSVEWQDWNEFKQWKKDGGIIYGDEKDVT